MSSCRHLRGELMMQQWKTHRMGQWATFFWPLAEGALLKICHVHKVYKEQQLWLWSLWLVYTALLFIPMGFMQVKYLKTHLMKRCNLYSFGNGYFWPAQPLWIKTKYTVVVKIMYSIGSGCTTLLDYSLSIKIRYNIGIGVSTCLFGLLTLFESR